MSLKYEKAAGIIAAIFIIVIVSLIGVVVASLLGTETYGSLNYLQSQQAFFIAESGIQYVLEKIRVDPDYRVDLATVNENFGQGSFSVEVIDQGAGLYTLTSTGTAGVATRRVTQSVDYTSLILEKTLHADGSLINFNDSTSSIVEGDVSCHVSVSGYEGIIITGTITENIVRLQPSLDFDYYASVADYYYTSNITFANDTYTGVYYTTKKAFIGNNTIINGSIIAIGTIEFNAKADNVQISPSNNYPALASNSGISSTDSGPPAKRIGLQNSTINGLVFCSGNITFDYMRNNTFNGSILSNGNINIQNGTNWTISYDEDIFAPITPGLDVGEELKAVLQDDWDENY